MKKTVFTTLMMILAAASLSSCGANKASGSSYTLPSTDPGGGGTGGAVSSAGMMINVVQQTQNVVTYLHKFNNFSSTCMIPANASSKQDIQCLLNVRELDLFHQGLKFEYNVPAGLCDYISETPSWYYNQAAGYGPQVVTVYQDQATPGNSTCSLKRLAGGPSIAGVMNGDLCTFANNAVTAKASGTATCLYDYSGAGGPNCCGGSYTYSKTVHPATGSDTVNVENLSWGGSPGLCAGSVANVAGSGFSKGLSGYPNETIHTGIRGLNLSYKIEAPINLAGANNGFAANFFGWSNYAAGTYGAVTSPLAYSYSTDVLGNPVVPTNVPYTFTCYDTAFEVRHRIRLYINEWDTSLAFSTYGASGNPTSASPESPLQNCDGTSDDCDDVWGWSRMMSALPGFSFLPK